MTKVRVRLLCSASGNLKPGDELEIPADEAAALVARGSAEHVAGKPAKKPPAKKPAAKK